MPIDAVRRLLTALGIQADTAEDVRSSLEALEQERWEHSSEPVHAAREGEPVRLDVRLPAGWSKLEWRIALEDGTQREGDCSFSSLPLIAANNDGAAPLACRLLQLDSLPVGYHELRIEGRAEVTTLIVAPARCWLPGQDRRWGFSTQLYLLRSASNWGIGDFRDLRDVAQAVVARGGDIVGINPLHALFPDNPQHASPYGPASRLLLNPLYIDVESLPERATCAAARNLFESDEFRARLERCRSANLVEFTDVARLKSQLLELLFAEARSAKGERWKDFETFRTTRGATFELHCVYFALRRHLAKTGRLTPHWSNWPDSLGDAKSPEVDAFKRERADDVTREAWLQWVADEQLEEAATAKLGIGLYRDLAVGCDSAGAETWAEPELVATGARVGAPPDPFSSSGQDWGLPPWNPREMRASRYSSFIQLVRANMRHAGALRIDHAMAIERLYWIPEGHGASDGAYVQYPARDLRAILAIESHRAHCVLVGEDLGTVPDGFRERMADAQILSYRVLQFERREDRFIAPQDYPRLALSVAANHDLPTFRGWWEGRDITIEHEYGKLSPEDLDRRNEQRTRERHSLIRALVDAGVLKPDENSFVAIKRAVHRYLGRTNALLALAQLEDIADQLDPVNAPSLPNYPSWRTRIPTSLEAMMADGSLDVIAAALAIDRSSAAG